MKWCGSTSWCFIRPASVVPVPWKCIFWTRRASTGSHPEQALDIGGHALVDQLEQPAAGRVQAIVEIENPVADMGEARVHERSRRLAALNLQQIERIRKP